MSQQLVLETFVLAFLVRTNNTAESRGWLDSVASALISKQRPCGSIHEYCNKQECSYGGGNSTKSCFCASNAAYEPAKAASCRPTLTQRPTCFTRRTSR